MSLVEEANGARVRTGERDRGTDEGDEGVTARKQESGGPGAGLLQPGPGPLTAVTGQMELRRVPTVCNK